VIDVEALRAETPGVDHVVHFNNAGASLMTRKTVSAITAYLESELTLGGYEALAAHESAVDGVYASVAALVAADPSEVALSDSATGAWNMIVGGLNLGEGDRILTTTTEYGSNWAVYLRLRERYGVETTVVRDAATGEIDLEELEREAMGGASLISVNHIPTNGGVVNAAADIGSIAKRAGVPFLLDACQSVGQLPVDVAEIGCDFLTGTSRKYIRGPRGVGFGFIASRSTHLIEPVFLDNVAARVGANSVVPRDDARRIQWFEHPWANVMGFREAINSSLDIGVAAVWNRIQQLAGSLRDGLHDIPGVVVRDRGSIQSGLVTFTVDAMPAPEVRHLLAARGINISHSTVNSAPFDMTMRGLETVCRASVHAFNTDEEIAVLLSAVEDAAR